MNFILYRAIKTVMQSSSSSSGTSLTIMVDLDTNENYMSFLSKAKDIGIMKPKTNYILITLVRTNSNFIYHEFCM